MLRIVHPRRAGQGTDPPAKRHRPALALILSNEEVRRVRATLHNLRRAYGGWDVLASVMGVPVGSLSSAASSSVTAKHRPSGTLAIRVAKAGGVSVESILSGAINEAGRCTSCGSRIGAGKAGAS